VGLLLVSGTTFGVETLYTSPRTEKLQSAVRAVRLSHVAMLNQETGLRGYILTHDPRYLEPYEFGRRELTHMDALIGWLDGWPDLSGEYLGVRLSEEAWTIQIAEPTIRSGSVDLDRSKHLFDVYRDHEARLERGLDGRLNSLSGVRSRILITGAAAQLAFFGLALVISRRRMRRLLREIVRPVAAVLGVIHAVGDGRLDPVKREPGPSELKDIQAGLDDMITALASERTTREARAREASERAASLGQILDSAREFSGSLNLRYVLRTLGRSACAASEAPRVVIWIFDDAGSRLNAHFDSDVAEGAPLALAPTDIGSGLVGRAARHGRTVTPDAGLAAGESARAPEEMAVPLIVGARVVGVLQLLGGSVDRLRAERREMLEILASHGAAAMESSRLHQAVEERSHRDGLTKLYNRRRLEEDLVIEVKRSRRYQSALSFVMIDVDHFKRFNDSYGHIKGDEVLEAIGQVMEKTLRDTDTAYRYGGEEFSVLLRDTPLAGAAEFAERLRGRIESHFQKSLPASPVTVSIGAAFFAAEMKTPSALIEGADSALYEAKRLGRNHVVTGPLASGDAANPDRLDTLPS